MDNRNSGGGLMKGFFLLCIGCILVAIGLSFGGKTMREFKFWPWNSDNFSFSWHFPDTNDDGVIRPVKILEGTLPAGIRNLAIDLKAASLDIRYGPDPGYRATDFREDSITITMEGDTLTVEETDWQHRIAFKENHLESHLEIILPEKRILDAGRISIGAGSLNISDIDAGQLQIESGAGSIKGSGIHADTVLLRTGAGSLDLHDCSFDDTVIETGAGRVLFEGDLTSKTEISTGAGSVELTLSGSEDDYRFDFTRGIGSVRIGRASYNGIGSGTAGNMDADRRLDITTGIGSVRVRFND